MTTPIEITDTMIDAGVAAYLGQAVHDQFSYWTPRELIEIVLRAGLTTVSDKHPIE